MSVVKQISTVEVSKLHEESGGIRIIDVRSHAEFIDVRSALALNIPLETINSETVLEASFTKDEPVYIICQAGGRSAMACKVLIEQGFKHVFNVTDGTSGWVQNGLNLSRGTGKSAS